MTVAHRRKRSDLLDTTNEYWIECLHPSTMAWKKRRDETRLDESIISLIHGAGYGEPTPLQKRVIPLILSGKDVVVETGAALGKTASFILPIICLVNENVNSTEALVLTTPENIRKISHQFARFSQRSEKRISHLSIEGTEDVRRGLKSLAQSHDVLISTPHRLIDHIRRGNIELTDVRIAVLDSPDSRSAAQFSHDVQFIYSKFTRRVQTVLLSSSIENGNANLVSILRNPTVVSDDATASAQRETARRLLDQADRHLQDPNGVQDLRDYLPLVRRHVSFRTRRHLAAYLLRECVRQSETGRFVELFVNVGKNRGVFPADIRELLTSSLSLGREDIGGIRIFDNYSFFELTSTWTDDAICQLSGTHFKGRKIVVRLAREKKHDR